MRWLGLMVALALFGGLTAGAYVASVEGWGLAGVLDRPVSLRQQSVRGGGYRRHGGAFIYFGSRRHAGGGYGHGK